MPAECSNFDRSALEVLRLLDHEKPKTHDEIFKQLWDNRTKILLGAQTSLAEFLEALRIDRTLSRTGNHYTLTKSGLRTREGLEALIAKVDAERK